MSRLHRSEWRRRLYQAGNEGQSIFVDQRPRWAQMIMKEGPARQMDSGIRDAQDQKKQLGQLNDSEDSISQAQSFAVVSIKPLTY